MALTATFGIVTDIIKSVTVPITITGGGNPCDVHVLPRSAVQITSRANRNDNIDLVDATVFCESANNFVVKAIRMDGYCGGFSIDIMGYVY